MRTIKSIEREIERLRAKHTELFERQEWLKAQSVREKVIRSLDQLHRAKEAKANHDPI